jgi:hypothetical protein
MTELAFDRRHVALDRGDERIANRGSDRRLDVNVGAIASLALEINT